MTKKSGMQQDGNIVNQLLFRYLPYWPLFVVMIILGVAFAYVYIRYKVPIYEANASILIKDERKGADESKIVEQMNLFGSKKIVENEIEMIRSRGLLKNVVKNLRLYAPVYEEGQVNVVPAFVKSPVELEVRSMDSIVEEKKIYFSYDKNKKTVHVEGKDYPLDQWQSSRWGTIRFLANPYYQSYHVQKPLFFTLVEPKKVIDYLDKQLTITPSSKQSTVITIKVKDPVPQRGKLILNELINQYDRASVTDKNQLALNTLKYLESQLAIKEKSLDSINKGIEQFRTNYNVVDLGMQGQQYLQGTAGNDQKVSEIDVQLSVLKEVESYVRSSPKYWRTSTASERTCRPAGPTSLLTWAGIPGC